MVDGAPTPSAFAPGPPKVEKPGLLERIGVPEIIDITLIFGLFCIVMVWLVHTPANDNQLLTSLVTGWLTLTTTVVNFHRGSSAGSKAKDDALIKEAKS